MRARTKMALALAPVLAAVLTLVGCSTEQGSRLDDVADRNYIAGDGAVTEIPLENRGEPITFEGLTDQGETVGSDDYLGDVLVVNFWYAACPPCRKEAPWLEELYQEFTPEGVEFLGVNIRDEAPTSLAFARNFGVTYPSIIDTDGGVSLAFAGEVSPNAVPTTLVLDREGRPAARIVGMIDESILRALVKTVLAEQEGETG